MVTMTSWAPEFCTVCYKQCLMRGVYCSEECRKADLEKTFDVPEKLVSTGHNAATPNTSSTELESITESSEEDDEVPSLWLAHNNPEPKQQSTQSHKQLQVRKLAYGKSLQKKGSNFLYASPTLKPSKCDKTSPVMSPLLIPHVPSSQSQNSHISAQSVSTYKRWLADGAV